MVRKEGSTIVDPGGLGVSGSVIHRDLQNPTVMTADPNKRGPFLDPRVSDPNAIRYAQEAESRRRGAPIPRYAEPVAGGPDVPIPALNGEAGNGTMAEQARAQRGAPAMPVPNLDAVLAKMGTEPALRRGDGGSGIIEGSSHSEPVVPQQARGLGTSIPAGLLRDDILPEQATKDPTYVQSMGSMYAANTPHLAFKYGVMRGGQYIAPHLLRQATKTGQGASKMRPETLEGLAALKELQEHRDRVENNSSVIDKQIEEDSSKSVAGGAGKTNRPLNDSEKKELLDDLDEFEMSRLKNSLFKDLLNNDDQKRIIEARLKPLDLGDLIVTGRVSQVVPIQPGMFEPEFQSYAAEEDLHIKRLVGEEAVALRPSDRYLLDKYQLMGLTIALVSINKRQFPDYRDAQGDFDKDKFWAKFQIVARLNYHMMASLMVNWFWFDMRVRRLFKADELGNG